MTEPRKDRVVPRPASTVALLRLGPGGEVEVLLTHRPPTMAFGPGLHVFPGGAVDADDGDGPLATRSELPAEACAAAWAGDLPPGTALAHAIAAIRELHEEADILLATMPDGSPVPPAPGEPLASLAGRLDLTLRTDWLVPLSRWVTPPIPGSRRFDTRFYVAWLPAGAEVAAAAGEVAAHEWLAPARALDRYAAGDIDLWPPTSSTLAQLDGVEALGDVRRLAPTGRAVDPTVDVIADGLVRIRCAGVGGRPGRLGDAWIVGRQRVVVVDPGDPSEAVLDAILGTVNRLGAAIGAVAVTSASPDRAGGAVGLALVAGVPLWASARAAPRIGEEARVLHDARITDGDMELVVRGGEGDLAFEIPLLGVSLPLDGGAPAG